MKKQLSLALAVAVSLTVASVFAAEKEQTITGKGMCAKCELGQTPKCQNAIQVTAAGKTTTYLLEDNAVSKAFHSKVCKGPVEKVTATGTAKTEGGKQVFVATKIQ
jgi:hypothetical protein